MSMQNNYAANPLAMVQAEINMLQSAIQQQNMEQSLAAMVQGLPMQMKRKIENQGFQSPMKKARMSPNLFAGGQSPLALLNAILSTLGFKEGAKIRFEENMGIATANFKLPNQNRVISAIGENAQAAKQNCAERACLALIGNKLAETSSTTIDKAALGRFLAILCISKAYSAWDEQGYKVPSLPKKWRVSLGDPSLPKKPSEDFKIVDPIAIMENIHEGILYNIKEAEDGQFISEIEIDGEVYTGTGKSGDEAKAACAQEVVSKHHLLDGVKLGNKSNYGRIKQLATYFAPVNDVKILRYPAVFSTPEVIGTAPNDKYKVTINIDGINCQGKGKTALEARKNCAIVAKERALKKKLNCRAIGLVSNLHAERIFNIGKIDKSNRTIKVTATVNGKTYTEEAEFGKYVPANEFKWSSGRMKIRAVMEKCAIKLLSEENNIDVEATPIYKLYMLLPTEDEKRAFTIEPVTDKDGVWKATFAFQGTEFEAEGNCRDEAEDNCAIQVLEEKFEDA